MQYTIELYLTQVKVQDTSSHQLTTDQFYYFVPNHTKANNFWKGLKIVASR